MNFFVEFNLNGMQCFSIECAAVNVRVARSKKSKGQILPLAESRKAKSLKRKKGQIEAKFSSKKIVELTRTN